MGGEYYSHPGGGASYLCLPHNPKYDKYKDGHQAVGYVYGTEYKVNDYNGDPGLLREIFTTMMRHASSASSGHVVQC